MSTEISDLFVKGESNCCGAKVYEGGRCSRCLDGCGIVTEAEAHLEAVKSGDEDCSPPCPTCSEEGQHGYEMSHGL